jgi:hypothetical protein
MPGNYKPREWGNKARANRDGAAEEVASALHTAVNLLDIENDPEKLRKIGKVIFNCSNALRHLESAGAQTKPRNSEL